MKLIYTRIAAAAALRVGTIANPDYYEHPNRSAEEVIIYGDYPKIKMITKLWIFLLKFANWKSLQKRLWPL